MEWAAMTRVRRKQVYLPCLATTWKLWSSRYGFINEVILFKYNISQEFEYTLPYLHEETSILRNEVTLIILSEKDIYTSFGLSLWL